MKPAGPPHCSCNSCAGSTPTDAHGIDRDGRRRKNTLSWCSLPEPSTACAARSSGGGRALNHQMRKGYPSASATPKSHPHGRPLTEWYKGKTWPPIWRQISAEICHLRSSLFRTGYGQPNTIFLIWPELSHLWAPATSSQVVPRGMNSLHLNENVEQHPQAFCEQH